MNKTPFWYSRDDGDRRPLTVEGDYSLHDIGDQQDLAEEAAQDHWNNHDGWESRWPLTIVLFETETGPEVVRFDVDMQTVPEFIATKQK